MVMMVGVSFSNLYWRDLARGKGGVYLSAMSWWNFPGSCSIDWASSEPYRCAGSRLAFPGVPAATASSGMDSSSGVTLSTFNINSPGGQSYADDIAYGESELEGNVNMAGKKIQRHNLCNLPSFYP